MENKKTNICPLLEHPETYRPDTFDLLKNIKEREYWLPTLDRMVKQNMAKAKVLNPENPKATEKAELCYKKFHKLIENLTVNPNELKPLTVRTLLEYQEDILRSNSFKDFWQAQKEKETSVALSEFSDRITFLDSIENPDDKWLELALGILAGNVFDWGSKAVMDILEAETEFNLSHAMSTIEKRPWFSDDLDPWIERIKQKPYNRAVIFVDNAGVDFVLGVLPFARELLVHNTEVILAGNSLPSLNDITFKELQVYTCRAAQSCDILANALISKKLAMVENGQTGPCLDLSRLTPELCDLMSDTDLVILEGMGRAVHTNYHAKFNVDSLKVAVLKNEWLARSLGAEQFSVIFEFHPAS